MRLFCLNHSVRPHLHCAAGQGNGSVLKIIPLKETNVNNFFHSFPLDRMCAALLHLGDDYPAGIVQ